MNGVIIIPIHREKWWTPKETPTGPDFSDVLRSDPALFYAMRDQWGFEFRYADEVKVGNDTDLVIMFGVPHHDHPELIPGLLELDKSIKLVMFAADIQCYGDEECLRNKRKVFERCDLIISASYETFVNLYPEFVSKFLFFPKFFAPHERYTRLSLNTQPKMRCLLSGAINAEAYPLRSFIKDTKHKLVDCERSTKYFGDSYAEVLNSYYCCVATSGVYNVVVSKYCEIPATGSLMLARETNDLRRIGFVPYKHYVPITKFTVFDVICECVAHPEDYVGIRKEGMEFVRNNHSIVNRITFLERYLEEWLK